MIHRTLIVGFSLLLCSANAQTVAVAEPHVEDSVILNAARDDMASRWPSLSGRTEIRLVRVSGSRHRTTGHVRVRLLSERPPRGRTSAEISSQTDDGSWRRCGWALLDVAWFDEAPVLTENVQRGERIELGAFRVARIETTALVAATVSADSLALGMWTAARDLTEGTPLTMDLLERETAALRGDPVRFRYERGAVAIELIGEARERGAVGDVIRVYNSDTRATHRVRMTAPGEGVWSGR